MAAYFKNGWYNGIKFLSGLNGWLKMRIDHAPYVSEIQDQFCPERTHVRAIRHAIWVRETSSGMMEISGYRNCDETSIIKSAHKVIQSYVLRRKSDLVIQAVAVVSSGGGEKIRVNEWIVTTLNADTAFASRLSRTELHSQIKDENDIAHSVANIGGGTIVARAEYLAEEKRRDDATQVYVQQTPRRDELRRRELARHKAEEDEEQLIRQEKKEFNEKAKYAFTADDIQQMLPVSAEHSIYADGYIATKVLQVFVLLDQDMKVFITAVASKRCTWLDYNSAGCHDYSFAPGVCDVVNRFTVISEQSKIGAELLSKQRTGEVIVIGQKPLLIVNVCGGDFVLYHDDWNKEKHEIERRLSVNLAREAERKKRALERHEDWEEQRGLAKYLDL